MALPYFTEETYSNLGAQQGPLPCGEYEACHFVRCDFSGQNLSGFLFTDCHFTDCNLSNVVLDGCTLNQVQFNQCKLTGTDFESCNHFLFSVRFDHCIMPLTAFCKRVMKGTTFSHCQLQDADFTETNLSQAVFSHCDLSGARFDQTNLEQADLVTSHSYRIDPDNNRIRKAQFALPEVLQFLAKWDIVVV